MWMIFLVIVFGLLSSSSSDNPTVKSRSCSYMGVFHVEEKARYNLTYEDAERLCEHLNASIAPMEQLQRAYNAGLETCRYGWIKDKKPVILRHKPHKSCAGNQTGIVTWERTRADAFCYDKNDSSPEDCSARSGIYLPGSESLDTSDYDSVSAGNETYVEIKDHENSTEGTHQEDTTASGSSTPVYWTANVSVSVNTSQSFTKNNETDETDDTKHPQSTPVKPDTDATGLDGPQSPNKNSSDATGQDMHKSPIKNSSDATGQDVHQSPIKNNSDATGQGVHKSPIKISSDATGQDVHQSPIKNSSDLMVILIVILAVLLILLICALVATRKRWCGKKRTLIITEKRSSDRKDTSAFTQQQEMTTLMNNEKNLS